MLNIDWNRSRDRIATEVTTWLFTVQQNPSIKHLYKKIRNSKRDFNEFLNGLNVSTGNYIILTREIQKSDLERSI